MTGKRYMTVEERGILLNLSEKGYSRRKFADKLKCDHSTVDKAVKRIRELQGLLNLPKAGRKRISTEGDDRTLLRIYKEELRK